MVNKFDQTHMYAILLFLKTRKLAIIETETFSSKIPLREKKGQAQNGNNDISQYIYLTKNIYTKYI